MKNIFWILLVGTSICVSACFDGSKPTCTIVRFNKKETFWIDTYRKGDTLLFSSVANNKIDTIFIIDKILHIPDGNCNSLVSDFDTEFCRIDYRYKNGDTLYDNDYFVQLEKSGLMSKPVLRVYDLEFNDGELKDTTVILKSNLKLDDCYSFHRKDCHIGWSDFKLKSFVWSRSEGLVLFVGLNGEKFELISK